uniref:Uncharacterized protein n=1 Tax=Cacopsylla melanoneura TaxID=428564 RepID=A0A8D8TCC3_9HEMI
MPTIDSHIILSLQLILIYHSILTIGSHIINSDIFLAYLSTSRNPSITLSWPSFCLLSSYPCHSIPTIIDSHIIPGCLQVLQVLQIQKSPFQSKVLLFFTLSSYFSEWLIFISPMNII